MKYIMTFWYDFIVGDDWRVAAGVVVALALTAVLSHQGEVAWWVIPITIVVMLAESMWRVARH